MADVVAQLRQRSGLSVVGAFAFGDSPALQDELLGFVEAGTKRATAGPVAEVGTDTDPAPEPGQYWGLLDGLGEPRFVTQTVEVSRGRLAEVAPAFAWDEGEYDRTLESWLEGHRDFFRRHGVDEPDDLEVIFERFRVVWPVPDATVWLADGVRELRFDEHEWLAEQYERRWGTTTRRSRGRLHDVAALPAVVREREGAIIGAATFRPDPGGTAECVTMDTFVDDGATLATLTAGLVELGVRNGWRRIWLLVDDDTDAVGEFRAAGWNPVGRHDDEVVATKQTSPDDRDVLPSAPGSPERMVELEVRLPGDGPDSAE